MRTILVVEDVALNRDLLTQLLEEHYRLLVAVDGEEAVRVARREHPDLILMDLSLPGMDGWEATRRLKADSTSADIPVIALTAHAMRGDDKRALDAGCDAYLTKPIDETALFEKIDALLPHGEPAP